MSWKEKIGQPDQKPAKKESSETPSRKRQRSDEVILDLFQIKNHKRRHRSHLGITIINDFNCYALGLDHKYLTRQRQVKAWLIPSRYRCIFCSAITASYVNVCKLNQLTIIWACYLSRCDFSLRQKTWQVKVLVLNQEFFHGRFVCIHYLSCRRMTTIMLLSQKVLELLLMYTTVLGRFFAGQPF